MKLEEALFDLRKGKKIKRKNSTYHYDGLTLDKYCDMLADDWEIIEEPGKTFFEVFEAFKEGKKIRRKTWNIGAFITILGYSVGWAYGMHPGDLVATDWEVIE